MTDVPTLQYRFQADTIEDVARGLIVASTMVPDGESMKVSMTGAQARHLGRALQAMAQVEASNAAARAYVDARVEQAAASDAKAKVILAEALRHNRAALIWLCACGVVLTLNLFVAVVQ